MSERIGGGETWYGRVDVYFSDAEDASMGEIKPALSAGEWAAVVAAEYDNGLVRFVGDNNRDRHALAALALHGQSFGVRYEMADAIAKAERGDPLTGDDRLWLRTAVCVILSLLPPRGDNEDMQAVRNFKG